MENGLIGTDVSPIAAHLTSSSLAAIGVGEPYGKTRIGWVRVGREKGKSSSGTLDKSSKVAIGSLDYFKNDEVRDLLDDIAGSSTGTGENSDTSVHIPENSIDWVLMNPPYSRTRSKQSAFDIAGLSDPERQECQAEWKKAVKNEPVTLTAGMAASFLALARRKVKPGGRIGFVLPLTAAFADTWAGTRRMIEREFTDITALAVAAGKALGKDALSADTGMEEMILVATRCRKVAKKHAPIKCVTLNVPVTRSGEAGEVARAILATGQAGATGPGRPIMAGKSEIGQIFVFNAGGEGAPWGPLGVTHSGLAAAAENLATGRLDFIGKSMKLSVAMTTLGELFSVGPTHDLIGHPAGGDGRGAFTFYPIKRSADAVGPDRALWAANKKAQRSLVVLPTHKGVPVQGRDAKWQEMRSRQGTLFYSRNMRWTSQALLAATTKHPAMGGNAWAALGHDDVRVRKAFALWMNSTLGMMVHWTRGQRTHAGRSMAKTRALGQIPCPRLDRLSGKKLDFAAATFDKLASAELLPTCQAHADAARQEIDSAVVSMLGLPKDAIEVVAELRFLWCREPSVHGNDKKALSLLAAQDGEQS